MKAWEMLWQQTIVKIFWNEVKWMWTCYSHCCGHWWGVRWCCLYGQQNL